MTLPKLSANTFDAEVIEWLVAVGDVVSKGQIICIVETAKVSMDLESPYDGTVVDIRVSVGEEAQVGDVLAVIE